MFLACLPWFKPFKIQINMRGAILLVFLFNFSLLKTTSSSESWTKYSGLYYMEEGYVYDFPVKCSTILETFAEYASNFTKCSIQHARPIRLCERCVEHYVKFYTKYQELLHTEINGTSCKSLFISHDRFEVVLEYHDSIAAIWDKGNCDDCFDWTDVEPKRSNSTKKFNTMFNETMGCIVRNMKPNMNDTDEVCQKCMQSYLELDQFYKTLSADAIGVDSICMDIVDSMNTTRSIWSKSLNCCKLRRTPEIVFLCCTGVIASLPFLFYIAVRFCGPIRDFPNVLKQSRFKQSILRNSDGRIN